MDTALIKCGRNLKIAGAALALTGALASQSGYAATTTPPPPKATAPNTYFDLSHWKLTLPVDTKGKMKGRASEVDPKGLTGGYTSKWFYSNAEDTMTFWSIAAGATTGGSKYSRSELREMPDPSNSKVNWTLADKGVLNAKLKISQVPKETGRVIVGQIHALDANPLVKLTYAYDAAKKTGELFAVLDNHPTGKDFTKVPLASNLPLGQEFTYQIIVNNVGGQGVLTLAVNGNAVDYKIGKDWNGIGMYYKAGAYVQAKKRSGDNDGARITFSKLTVTHPNKGLAIQTSALPQGQTNAYFSQQLVNTGGSGAGTWTVANGRLPKGFTLSSNGLLAGSSATPLAKNITFMVTDQERNNAAKSFDLVIR